jgi:hypothetical protein
MNKLRYLIVAAIMLTYPSFTAPSLANANFNIHLASGHDHFDSFLNYNRFERDRRYQRGYNDYYQRDYVHQQYRGHNNGYRNNYGISFCNYRSDGYRKCYDNPFFGNRKKNGLK